jgi:hypothetical protein
VRSRLGGAPFLPVGSARLVSQSREREARARKTK